MRKIIEYRLVESTKPGEVGLQVTQALKEGFELYGYHKTTATQHNSYMSQALVKYDRPEEK